MPLHRGNAINSARHARRPVTSNARLIHCPSTGGERIDVFLVEPCEFPPRASARRDAPRHRSTVPPGSTRKSLQSLFTPAARSHRQLVATQRALGRGTGRIDRHPQLPVTRDSPSRTDDDRSAAVDPSRVHETHTGRRDLSHWSRDLISVDP